MTEAQTKRLVSGITNTYPVIRGWVFSYEYPGIFTYRKGSVSICFTPDYSTRGETDIQCSDDEGTLYDDVCDVVAFDPNRSVSTLIRLVKPFLEKAEKHVR